MALCKEAKQTPALIKGPDDPAWKQAIPTEDFTVYDANLKVPIKVHKQTRAKWLHDEKFLYFLIECEEDTPALLRAEESSGGPVWRDSSVELFFDTKGDTKAYLQMVINSKGAVYIGDEEGKPVNLPVTIRAKASSHSWWVEGSVAFRDLGLSTPAPGSTLKINMARNDQLAHTTSSWAFVNPYGRIGAPEAFGNLQFLSPGAATEIVASHPAARHRGLIDTPELTDDNGGRPNRWKLSPTATQQGNAVQKGEEAEFARLPTEIRNLQGRELSISAYCRGPVPIVLRLHYRDQEGTAKDHVFPLPAGGTQFTLVQERLSMPADAVYLEAIGLESAGKPGSAAISFLQLEQSRSMRFAYNNPSGDLTQKDQAVLYPLLPEVGVFSEVPSPLMWGSWHTFDDMKVKGSDYFFSEIKRQFKLSLDLPDGFELKGLNEHISRPHVTEHNTQHIKRDAEGFTRHQMSLPGLPLAPWVTTLSTTLPPGQRRTGTFQLDWGNGQTQEMSVELVSVKTPSISPPKRLTTGIHLICDEGTFTGLPTPSFLTRDDFGGFGKQLKQLGYNCVILWVLEWRGARFSRETPRMDAFVKHLKNEGLEVVAEFSPFYYFKRPLQPDETVTLKDGTKRNVICPSYRGELYQDQVADMRLLGSHGIDSVEWDFEIYNEMEEKICYCARCKAAFQSYLSTAHPQVASFDPQEIQPMQEEATELWKTFIHRQLGGWMRDFRAGLQEGYKSQGHSGQVTATVICNPGGFEWKRLVNDVDRFGPMIYAYYNWRPEPTVRSIGNDVHDFAGKLGWENRKLVVTLAPGERPMYGINGHKGRGPRPANNEMVFPRIGMKYQVLEALAGGSAGFTLYYWNGMDALAFAHVADAIEMVNPVEDFLLDGAPQDVPTSVASAKARKYTHKGGTLLFVSEYSLDPVSVDLEISANEETALYDLATREKITTVQPSSRTLPVTLDQERVRLLLLTNTPPWIPAAITQNTTP